MTKIGLRDRILLITLLPTLCISLCLGGYFSYARYQDQAGYLESQAINISEPLAIASEQALLRGDKELLQRLLNVAHRKNAPMVRTIAVFDHHHRLIATSNQHKDFAEIDQPLAQPNHTVVSQLSDSVLVKTPIIIELSALAQLLNAADLPSELARQLRANDGRLGYVLVQIQKDKIQLVQQQSLLIALLLVLLGLTAALVLSLRFLSRISTPVQQLLYQIEKLAEGRYSSQLPGPYVAELDLMRIGINQLAVELKRYKEDLQNTVDQSTSDLLQAMEQLEMQNVALDLSRRKAQADNKLKSEFLAKMSHELRTPLNGVIGFTRQLLKTQLTLHQQDYLNTIQKSANSLLSLVNDVLDYSKLEEGRMPINPEPFSLRELVNDSIELLAAHAFEKQLELALWIDPNCPDDIIGDPLRINQILMNITGNAIKFTEHGSIVVRITATLQPDERVMLHVSVQDTGVGIATQQQEQLFSGFAQSDGSIGRRYGGTGLGLIISQRLVNAMGGSIGFDSKIDEGSTFWFTLLCKVHSLSVSDALPVEQLNGKSVLYIEPQQYSREATLTLLNSWGMKVAACSTPAQIQQALAQSPSFDIAIIGRAVSLDQVNQIVELIRQLRSHCQYIYLLVNTLSPNLREALLHSGAQACLSKPAHHRKLANTMARPYQTPDQVFLPSPQGPKAPLRILTVDDNEANLKLINTLLSDLVEHIDSATQGAEAWQKASHNHYDVIFMDINMPVMDGVTACQKIRHSSLNETTPIIAVTAHAMSGERERLLSLGFREFLSKPLDEQMLLFALKECCPAFSHNHRAEAEKSALGSLPQSRHLDWELALQRAAGKVELAKEMLQILLKSLPDTLQELRNFMATDQREPLIQLIHKLHGATCYTGVPHIKQLTEIIETQLKAGSSISLLEPELFDLEDQLQHLLAESSRWQW